MTTTDRAMDRLRLELERRFGKAIAQLIMISAANEAAISLTLPQPDDYHRLLEALSRHPRVVDHYRDSMPEELAYWRSLAS